MKILFVSEYFLSKQMGGGEISLLLLAKALAKRGHEVHVLTSKCFGQKMGLGNVILHELLATGKDPSSLIGNIKRIFLARSVESSIKKLHKKHDFDIVHIANINAAAGAARAMKRINAPFVAGVNSPVPFCPKGTLMYMDKKECNYKCTFRRFLKCFLNSREFGKMRNRAYLKYNPLVWVLLYIGFLGRKTALRKFGNLLGVTGYIEGRLLRIGMPGKGISVINDLVGEEFFRLKPKSNPKPRLLFLGAYLESKGVMTLLEALKDFREYECSFYGSGPMKNEMKRYAGEHKLNVKIHGKAGFDEIPVIINSHDIVVFPSIIPEAYGRVVVESLALQKIVVASRVGGPKYLIADGVNGLLFAAGNASDLKSKIKTAISNKRIIKKIRETLKDEVLEYSGKFILDQLEKLYIRIMRESK